MHINIFGDRQARVPQGWVKETLVGIFGDSTLDASAEPGRARRSPTSAVQRGHRPGATRGPCDGVFDPPGVVTGGGGFIADQQSVGVAPPTPYRRNASAQYDPGATVPRGLADLDVPGAGQSVRATGFDFLVVRGDEATWEGSATLNGAGGYRYRATPVVGSALAPTETSMKLWRPGSTSPANPDLPIGGPIDKGQITTH